ncbi:hypothetical protein Pmar_PMAR007498 [Perkinsus marinus ATCC 50983]|uniref:SAP domain-containing protein n=1 Tax=Perkinsus marinus (strain ATCC 50983 / TXsc) TaxID=423536 RepID=C5M070_PERM5|nr:hypothetical protein Pmar_PMAR007498 [Perkinsus marinus ATCC 50983]EEQ97648.1 hypothetical protein Pmar_PMAR007498 [Perkinsus marinus ATCC 50983]|eukprot:XP_002764931.1 hypothetical protein Pmar_PMAR007498 [Perkinsus marinus ATCC 50983]
MSTYLVPPYGDSVLIKFFLYAEYHCYETCRRLVMDNAVLPLPTREGLTRLKVVELKEEMKAIGLKSSGLRKQELIDRLLQYYGDAAHTESTTGSASSGSSGLSKREEPVAVAEAQGGGDDGWDEREVLEAMRMSLVDSRPHEIHSVSSTVDVVELQDSSQGSPISGYVDDPPPDSGEPSPETGESSSESSGPSPESSGPSPESSGPSPESSGPSPEWSGPSPESSGPSPGLDDPSFDSSGHSSNLDGSIADVQEPAAKKAKTAVKICPIFIQALGVRHHQQQQDLTVGSSMVECPLCEDKGVYVVHGTGQEQACRMCRKEEIAEEEAESSTVMVANIKIEEGVAQPEKPRERLDLTDFSRDHLGELACLVRDKGFDIVEAAEAMRKNDYVLYNATKALTAAKELAEENLARNQAAEESLATRDVEKKRRSKSEKDAFLEGGIEFLDMSQALAGPDLWEHLEAVVDFLLDNRMARLALFMYLQERKRAIAWYKVPAKTYFVANMPIVSSIGDFLTSITEETNKIKEAMYDLPKCGGATPALFRQFEDAPSRIEDVAVVETDADSCNMSLVELDVENDDD